MVCWLHCSWIEVLQNVMVQDQETEKVEGMKWGQGSGEKIQGQDLQGMPPAT